MPGINPGDIIEVVHEGTVIGQKVLSVFHYRVNVASSTPDIQAALAAFSSGYSAGANSPMLAMLNCQAPNYVLDALRLQVIKNVRSLYRRVNKGLPGTRESNCVASNIAACITKRGEQGNRHNIGTLHIPGIAGDDLFDGKVSDGLFTLMGTLASKMTGIISAVGDALEGSPIIYNRTNPVLSAFVYSPLPQRTLRTMYRRTVGVGK